MKKLFLVVSTLFAISGLVFTSCQKDKVGSTSFSATLEECQDDDGKTAFYNGTLRWVSGDRIKVFGNVGNGVYVASVHGGGDAVFTVESGDAGGAPYRAVYPATAANDDGTVELPVVQKTVDGSLTGFPMYAQGSSTNLDFKNLCGVLRMRMRKSGVSIIAIEVTGDIMVTGDYNVSYNNRIPSLEYYSHGTKTTMMTCATPQSIENQKDFYIFLPVHTYGEGMRIRIYSSDGRVCTKTVTANHNVNIQRSKITTITLLDNNLTFVPDAGVLPGLFAIDAAGHQVRFSQGNLQYTTLGVWRFAPDQYKCIASDNEFISDVYPKWIDLFGWGTGNNPTLASTDYRDYSDFVDWGSNAIINGGNVTNRWRTLTKDEWTYLFFTRSNTALGTTDNARYVKAKVNDVQGIILFPNGYNHPTDLSIPQYINNTSGSGWNANNYTLAQWSEMEAAGAVFFPLTGYRAGTECRYPNLYGMYWSSTPDVTRYSHCLSFASHFIQTDNGMNCSYGFGVRPVLDNN